MTIENDDFEVTLAQFYEVLLSKQERLGKEFEKVLYDNLWDLYARDTSATKGCENV